MCKECNVYQSVSHILFDCNNLELTKNRDVLNDKLSKYVHYPSMSEQEKLKTTLNLKPLCKKEIEEDACQTICSFVKKSYDIVQWLSQWHECTAYISQIKTNLLAGWSGDAGA